MKLGFSSLYCSGMDEIELRPELTCRANVVIVVCLGEKMFVV